MSFITKYGSFWGFIPQTAGNIYWVSPSNSYTIEGRTYDASDDNDGLSPEKALRTIDRAWNLVNAGDVIVPLPGTHSPSASIGADVAGVIMTGLPNGVGNILKQKTTIAAVTGDQTINVTAANIEISYLNIIPITSDSAIDVSAAGDQLHVHHCSFDMSTPAANTGTIGIDAIGAASNLLVDNCYFECDGAQGGAIVATALLDSIIEDCTFSLSTGTWGAVIVTGAATDRLYIRRCSFLATNATITIGINGTAATIASGVQAIGNVFSDSVSVALDGFGAGEAEIAENYQLGVGSTDGGVLIVAIT